MDGRQFDQLTRLLGDRRSRRRLLGRTVAGTLGTALGLAGRGAPAPVGAACLAVGKRCRPDERCCAGRCKGGRCRCEKDRDCPDRRFCERGRCRKQLGFARPCDDDNECRSGVCDRHSGACLHHAFACNPDHGDKRCPGGRCCQDENVDPHGARCVYQNQRPRGNGISCGPDCVGFTSCGKPAVCQDGICCCPPGVECNVGVPPCAP